MSRVMRRFAHSIAFALACTAMCAPAFAGAPRADDAAITRLRQAMAQDARYTATWPKLRCLDFMVEAATQAGRDIAVMERHGGACAGDPATAPVVDRFRVPAGKAPVQIYDPVEDTYAPYRLAR
jgi:hypothetical protein